MIKRLSDMRLQTANAKQSEMHVVHQFL